MKHAGYAPRDQRGSAIVTALLLVVGTIVLTFSLFRTAATSSERVSGGHDDRRAFLLAEAGLHEAYQALRLDGTGAVGSIADPAYMGGGVFWVDATDLGGNRHRLRSTGMAGEGRRALEVVVDYTGGKSPIFEVTLNSREQLTMNQGVVVDSYDSSLGDYASQALNTYNTHTYASQNGDVKSTEGIVLNNLATVLGDATPGVGYSVSYAAGAEVTGSDTPGSTNFTFPPITVPSYPSNGSISVPTNGFGNLASGKWYFSSLTVNKGATLTVTGPASIVVDDFTGGKDGNMIIDATNGPVEIYVTNSYTHLAGFEADAAPGSPMALGFLVEATQDIVFPANTAIRGGYYLPNANIVFSNANECWGAFAANRIDMSNDMKFHYDENLAENFDANTGQGNDGVDVLGWAEVDVQPTALVTDRRDPLEVLGLNRWALQGPSELLEGVGGNAQP